MRAEMSQLLCIGKALDLDLLQITAECSICARGQFGSVSGKRKQFSPQTASAFAGATTWTSGMSGSWPTRGCCASARLDSCPSWTSSEQPFSSHLTVIRHFLSVCQALRILLL